MPSRTSDVLLRLNKLRKKKKEEGDEGVHGSRPAPLTLSSEIVPGILSKRSFFKTRIILCFSSWKSGLLTTAESTQTCRPPRSSDVTQNHLLAVLPLPPPPPARHADAVARQHHHYCLRHQLMLLRTSLTRVFQPPEARDVVSGIREPNEVKVSNNKVKKCSLVVLRVVDKHLSVSTTSSQATRR
jgi:hypothetical protein